MIKALFFTGLSFFVIEFLSIFIWILIAAGITMDLVIMISSILMGIGLNILFAVIMLKGLFEK